MFTWDDSGEDISGALAARNDHKGKSRLLHLIYPSPFLHVDNMILKLNIITRLDK
jgi:hypothetical protein